MDRPDLVALRRDRAQLRPHDAAARRGAGRGRGGRRPARLPDLRRAPRRGDARARRRRRAVRHLAPRRGRRLHLGRFRRGDLRGGRPRLPRAADHDRGVRREGAAAGRSRSCAARRARRGCRTGATASRACLARLGSRRLPRAPRRCAPAATHRPAVVPGEERAQERRQVPDERLAHVDDATRGRRVPPRRRSASRSRPLEVAVDRDTSRRGASPRCRSGPSAGGRQPPRVTSAACPARRAASPSPSRKASPDQRGYSRGQAERVDRRRRSRHAPIVDDAYAATAMIRTSTRAVRSERTRDDRRSSASHRVGAVELPFRDARSRDRRRRLHRLALREAARRRRRRGRRPRQADVRGQPAPISTASACELVVGDIADADAVARAGAGLRRDRQLRRRDARRPLDPRPAGVRPHRRARDDDAARVGARRTARGSSRSRPTRSTATSRPAGASVEDDPLRPSSPYSARQGRRRPAGARVRPHVRRRRLDHARREHVRAEPVPGEADPALRHERARRRAAAGLRRRAAGARVAPRRGSLRRRSSSCCARARAGEVYNVGGEEHENIEVTHRILELTGADPALVRHVEDRAGPRSPLRARRLEARAASAGRREHSFGETGLAATVDWYRANRVLVGADQVRRVPRATTRSSTPRGCRRDRPHRIRKQRRLAACRRRPRRRRGRSIGARRAEAAASLRSCSPAAAGGTASA